MQINRAPVVAAVAAVVALLGGACADPTGAPPAADETAPAETATVGTTATSAPATPRISPTPVLAPLGTSQRYHDGDLDVAVTVARARRPAPTELRGDLVGFEVTVAVTSGTLRFSPDLVQHSWGGMAADSGRVEAGPTGAVSISAGGETAWTLVFGVPAAAPDATITVYARPGTVIGHWEG